MCFSGLCHLSWPAEAGPITVSVWDVALSMGRGPADPAGFFQEPPVTVALMLGDWVQGPPFSVHPASESELPS